MIIIEGHDNSGKSTLGKHIADRVGLLDIKESEGPPKYPNEMNERVLSYALCKPRTLFVRHPCVSELIYGPLIRPNQPKPIMDELIESFYATSHLFIYCDPLDRGLQEHNVKPGETAEHLTGVALQYAKILGQYRFWGIRHAHIFYRIGDDMDRVAHWAGDYLNG